MRREDIFWELGGEGWSYLYHAFVSLCEACVPGVCNDGPTRHDPVPDVRKAVTCFDYVQGGTMKTEVVVFKVITHHHIIYDVSMIKEVGYLCDA
jgi:hypothetical protein